MTTGKYNIVFSISDQALIFLLLLFLYLYLRITCNLKQTEWISENWSQGSKDLFDVLMQWSVLLLRFKKKKHKTVSLF